MTILKFDSRKKAAAHLTQLGMSYVETDTMSDSGNRERWAYGDGTDALADHSANIDRIGRNYLVSVFERKTAETPTPAAKPAPVRAARPVRADRHYNDDDTVTLYLGGRKILRTDEGDEDAEERIERHMNRHFPKKNGGWVYGRSTHGHNWHTKKAKAARLAAEAAAAAKG